MDTIKFICVILSLFSDYNTVNALQTWVKSYVSLLYSQKIEPRLFPMLLLVSWLTMKVCCFAGFVAAVAIVYSINLEKIICSSGIVFVMVAICSLQGASPPGRASSRAHASYVRTSEVRYGLILIVWWRQGVRRLFLNKGRQKDMGLNVYTYLAPWLWPRSYSIMTFRVQFTLKRAFNGV